MKFSETKYGDISQEKFYDEINVSKFGLTSLEGSPIEINGIFNCSLNNLTNLVGSPKKINGVFTCSFNNLVDLKGRPKKIGINFSCRNNKLISLEGAPKEIKNIFDCRNNPKLKNIKEQIIKYGIKAYKYYTDEGDFSFEDIKEEFNDFSFNLKKRKQQNKNIDFGLSI